MNTEKLQELVKQATVKVNNPYIGSDGNVALDCWEEQLSIELLADLIVKECGILADQHQFERNTPNPRRVEPLPLVPSDFILRHFGSQNERTN